MKILDNPINLDLKEINFENSEFREQRRFNNLAKLHLQKIKQQIKKANIREIQICKISENYKILFF